jgi:hypothetical protein
MFGCFGFGRGPFLTVTILSFAAVLAAQTPDAASIHGQVVDQNRAAVAGAQVKVTNALGKAERTAQSDGSGYFSFEGLPVAGTWEVTAGKSGFADARAGDLVLIGGTAADITLQLNVAGGQTHVSVTGVVGEVRTDEPQLGDYLGSQTIEETPLPNRRLTWLPMLNAANRPAINQGDVFMNENLFTSNGAGRRQAWFEVDGSTGNDSWGRQTIFSNIPIDAVQEMTILENAFSAEYGGSTGSAVNIVTKTGGEKLHASVLELWRPSTTTAALSGFTAANAASGNDVATDSLGQTAASVSGPIGGESTHYFLSGEDSRENRASPVISPVEPGNFVGHYRGWLGFFRIDHKLNDRNNLFFRSDVDGFHDTNPNGIVGGNTLPTVARTFRRRTYSEEIGETFVISPTLVNSLRLQFQLASPITEFDPAVYGTQFVVPISTGGTFTTGTSQNALLLNRQYQVGDTLSTVKGKHNIRFGGDMIYAHTGGNSKEFGGPIYLGQFTYNTCTQSLAYCESSAYLDNIANVKTYAQSYGNASYTVNDNLWALFVQDDYHVRPDLTINLGLRYEQQTFTDSRKDFAPRVGFAYNVNGDGKTVMRGGFGIYYSQIVDNSEANYALTGVTGVFNYTAAPGQVGFPTSVAAAPLPAFPTGAIAPLRSIYLRPGDPTFASLGLTGYPTQLLNPYSEQWSFGVERRLKQDWILSVDYVGTHTLRINRPLDVDAPAPFVRTQPGQVRSAQAANCTRPYWILWYALHNLACNTTTATNPQPPYSVIQTDVNDGYLFYDALDVNLSHRFSHGLSMLASYTWSHAIDNVDPDTTSQNPNDANYTGRIEQGNAIYDQRQRFVLSGFWVAPLKINVGTVTTLATGLPYNITTGVTNSGDTGGTTDRPVINGVVIGRNAGRGTPIYDFSPFLERTFPHITLRAEAFNALNHANFVGFSGTYGNGATAGPGFGAPLVGITNQLPARSLQFSARVFF